MKITTVNLALRPDTKTQPVRRLKQQPETILITSDVLREMHTRVREIVDLVCQQRRCVGEFECIPTE